MTTKAKVLHLTYDMRIGGTESVIKSLVEGLDSSRYEAQVLCIEPNIGPFGEQLVDRGIKVTNLSWTGGFSWALIKQIKTYINKNNIDILHCHQYTPWFYGTLAAALSKTKVIFTEHGRFYPDRSSWKRKYINPLLLLTTKFVTAISSATRKALSEFEFIPESKVDVVYNGIVGLQSGQKNTELKQALGIRGSDFVFGTVARLVPIKNQRMMIEAFARTQQKISYAKLLIVGDGELRTDLEALADHLGIRQHIIFTGYQSDPAEHLRLMDVFLLSSFSEGTSMTLLEAMSLAKPCVVTDAGGNAEVIKDSENGFVTPNDNCQMFADAMIKVAEDKSVTDIMGKAGKARFDQMFSQSSMVRKYHELYEKSLG